MLFQKPTALKIYLQIDSLSFGCVYTSIKFLINFHKHFRNIVTPQQGVLLIIHHNKDTFNNILANNQYYQV